MPPPSVRLASVLLVLFALIAAFTISPYNSEWMPGAPDIVTSFGHVAQAEMAIKEGQFPIRIAPWENNGWRNPTFQFYAPLPYTILGLAAIVLPGDSPWLAMKWMLFFALILAAAGMYLLALRLAASKAAAVVAACAYITAPYLLVNLHARGAIAEALGQCLLPWCAYFLVRAFQSRLLEDSVIAGIVIVALFLTHPITAIYFTVAASLVAVAFAVLSRSAWKSLLILPMVLTISGCLGAYYFLPMTHNQELAISSQIKNPSRFNFLTPILELVSPTSVPPAPDGVTSCPNLHAAIGLPLLLGVCLFGYRIFIEGRKDRIARAFGIALLAVVAALFVLVWSPVDFWDYLPRELYIVQFPYRNLAQIQWLCAVALALGLSPWLKISRGENPLPIVAAIAICVIASSSYLTVNSRKTNPVELLKAPTLGYGAGDYLENTNAPSRSVYFENYEIPAVYSDGWTWIDKDFTLSRSALASQSNGVLRFAGEVALVAPPLELSLMSGQQRVVSTQLADRLFEWNIPIRSILAAPPTGTDLVPLRFTPSKFLTPEAPPGRKLVFRHKSLSFHGLSRIGKPVSAVQPGCHNYGSRTRCEIDMGPTGGLAELPVLHYADFLDVKVNGKPSPYEKLNEVDPKTAASLNLVGVTLGPGTSIVDAEFIGSRPGNWISVFSIVAATLALLSDHLRKRRGLKPIQIL